MRTVTRQALRQQNEALRDTPGVSANAPDGFLPAFKDTETGEVRLSLRRDGSLAPVHLLEGLPQGWVASRDSDGRINAVKASIVSGFVRAERFYTRSELVATRDPST